MEMCIMRGLTIRQSGIDTSIVTAVLLVLSEYGSSPVFATAQLFDDRNCENLLGCICQSLLQPLSARNGT